MEFLPGHNLNEMIERYGLFPAGRVVYLVDQICAALAEAHGIGLVHRDIKPANIFCRLSRRHLRRGQVARFRLGQAAGRED